MRLRSLSESIDIFNTDTQDAHGYEWKKYAKITGVRGTGPCGAWCEIKRMDDMRHFHVVWYEPPAQRYNIGKRNGADVEAWWDEHDAQFSGTYEAVRSDDNIKVTLNGRPFTSEGAMAMLDSPLCSVGDKFSGYLHNYKLADDYVWVEVPQA